MSHRSNCKPSDPLIISTTLRRLDHRKAQSAKQAQSTHPNIRFVVGCSIKDNKPFYQNVIERQMAAMAKLYLNTNDPFQHWVD